MKNSFFAFSDAEGKSCCILTRDLFREGVFARDNNNCVVCHNPATAAHHIVERRLFVDGGYYLWNGASLCDSCHIKAEQTLITCDQLREIIGAKKVILPEHLYDGESYDKWANMILPNGMRVRGELFDDESVQKILEPVSHLFTKYVKYPRTYHFPWSTGMDSDDRMLKSLELFQGKRVIAMVKLDGENTTMTNDHVYARSLDSRSDFTRHYVQNLQSKIGFDIPEGWRLSGENLWARHTVEYNNLTSYFAMFGMWDGKNILRSWDETKEWGELLGLEMCPVIYDGIWNEEHFRNNLYQKQYNGDDMEGYVIRLADDIPYRSFCMSVGKFVTRDFKTRMNANHGHWRSKGIQRNQLRKITSVSSEVAFTEKVQLPLPQEDCP